jgi:tetratricopeptide (TPR) repeat protein
MDRFPSTPEGRTAQAAIADSNKAGDAKPILEEVVKLPNAPALSVNNLLVHYKFKDQPEKSLELIERGIGLDPEFSSYLFFWYKTSWINVNKGREDAKAYIKSLEARFGTGHWLLDYLQARLDEDTYKENALQSYAKAVSRKGAGFEVWNRYISLLWKVGSEKDRYSWGNIQTRDRKTCLGSFLPQHPPFHQPMRGPRFSKPERGCSRLYPQMMLPCCIMTP